MGAWYGGRELAAAKHRGTAGRDELMPVQIQSPLAKGARAAPWRSKASNTGAWRASGSSWIGPVCCAQEPPEQGQVNQGRWCAAGERENSREGKGEVEALAQAPEHDEGPWWEGACGHLAEGQLKASWRALAAEAAVGAVGAGATIAAHAGHTAPCSAVHLTVLACRSKGTRLGCTPSSHPCAPYLGNADLSLDSGQGS